MTHEGLAGNLHYVKFCAQGRAENGLRLQCREGYNHSGRYAGYNLGSRAHKRDERAPGWRFRATKNSCYRRYMCEITVRATVRGLSRVETGVTVPVVGLGNARSRKGSILTKSAGRTGNVPEHRDRDCLRALSIPD